MAEEEEEGEGDGEDSAALAGGGGDGQKRTQGQKSEGCAAGSQKTDCGHKKLPRSKPHKGDQRSETDHHGIKGARKGSDMERGGVQGSKVVQGFRGGLSEVRSSRHSEVRSSRARWTRDSPGTLALSHHHFSDP